MSAAPYLASQTVSDTQIQDWIETFHRDGYIFLHHFLPPDWVAELKADLERVLRDLKPGAIAFRLFETSNANLRLFDMEPLATFAETLVSKDCHVIHNNSFATPPGSMGISRWHQDDPPHYLVTHGDPPTNVRLPVLLFTANFYLTDVTDPSHGPTEFVPGSHLFGATPPTVLEGTKWADQVVPCLGPAGSAVIFNNQVWHRGTPNRSERTRCITQVSYGRRIINHMYFPFMNYQMPEHVYADANPRLKRLLGFLPTGPYG
ncbi:MAG: Mitomycin antibiotics/polyketide fumonisin biosynthesis protein [Chloroflexi bacterium]|nr:Mitomycin antibiotics/polyketide fumonisin biosynthesis protein [Chloroflexota bacterium]